MPYETIRYEVDETILTITLNRPDKLNAFTTQMLHEMIDAFDHADKDDAVKAVIITVGASVALGPTSPAAVRPSIARPATTVRHFCWARTVSRISQAMPRATAADA